MEMTADESSTGRKYARWALALGAVAFGILTLKSGGEVLFGSDATREAAGDYVPFVLWFNFSAGIFYVIAGLGLGFRQWWARWLAAALAVSSGLVFAAFGLHIAVGGAYEMRTVLAMTLRTVVWIGIAIFAFRHHSAPSPTRESRP